MPDTQHIRPVFDQHYPFAYRHIGTRDPEQQVMLDALSLPNTAALTQAVVPEDIQLKRPLALPEAYQSGLSEVEALAHLRAIADHNQCYDTWIGQGYYNTHLPAVIERNVLQNPAWYTAYTPYQPEISQGRLEALLNFQTMVSDLTGVEVANASLLDEASAAAEAMLMSHRASKSKQTSFFVDAHVHPQTLEVLYTRAAPLGIRLIVGDARQDLEPEAVFGALIQYPNTYGDMAPVDQLQAMADALHAAKGLLCVATDLLALTIVTPPGEWGADIVLGSSQRFGVPMGNGGPHAAFFACDGAFKRMMPGRIVGVSVDSEGRTAYRLSLQTREQHIRREKATSNICTAQALLAIVASMYAVYHGPKGLKIMARQVHWQTQKLARALSDHGFEIANVRYFDTLLLKTADAKTCYERVLSHRINIRLVDAQHIGISLDETTTDAHIIALLEALTEQTGITLSDDPLDESILAGHRRESAYLTHPVFNLHRSETDMLRYMRALSDKDLALDRTMIPLGSCTMKLNATSEMLPISWPEFSNIHPFAPKEQMQGYQQLFDELEQMLCACTGYDAVSLQPNSGAQGEYAGLMAIRRYHEANGDQHRRICLIPSSAHGTNPASAQLAGMQVVVVACDSKGNIDLADLRKQCDQYADELAAIMVTYPSTHGVFEREIRAVCELIHAHGGQVYLDGANLNAQLGLSAPGEFGADVSHLNLHKTFCIPHGGGGPGVGPIGVKAHLSPYLPGHGRGYLDADSGSVTGAPHGSAMILPISWMYIAMMGAEGMRRATEAAILHANYIATRLSSAYDVLYTGDNGWVAHECILDIRPIKEQCGIDAEDIAKRLIDYGFHAPTMSFPVPGTLMIEPTESEPLSEIDRFIDAMLAIRAEIDRVIEGVWTAEDNPLTNAPHTAEALVIEAWPHAYSRAEAVYPLETLRQNKFWPPVSRVDNVYGDRNLVCSCPPMSDYQ